MILLLYSCWFTCILSFTGKSKDSIKYNTHFHIYSYMRQKFRSKQKLWSVNIIVSIFFLLRFFPIAFFPRALFSSALFS